MEPTDDIYSLELDPQGLSPNWKIADQMTQAHFQEVIKRLWLAGLTAPYVPTYRRGYVVPVPDLPCYN